LAWLHSAPKQHKNDEDPKSRIETLEEDNPVRELPDADDYLTARFHSTGMFLSGGMGMAPLTWSEISAYIDKSGYELTGWDAEQIFNMSQSYCAMAHKARKLDCPAPYNLAATDQTALEKNREIVADKFKMMKENRRSFKGKGA